MFCKDCSYWKKNTRLGECQSKKWKRGYWQTPGDIANDEIILEDDEGWGCFTGPEFGCIHFQKKTPNKAFNLTKAEGRVR